MSKEKLRRSAILLGVAVLFALAGYLLQKVEDGGGEPAPDVPASELTPSSREQVDLPESDGTRAATIAAALRTLDAKGTATPGTAVPTANAASRDLAADEARGGHTLARHVGKTDAELRDRLKAEPDISAASTYFDAATAGRVVAEVLSRKSTELRKWEERDGSRPNLVLRLDTGKPIGRSIKQGQSNAREVDSALVVLRWAGTGWFVLTSYPEDR